MPDETCTICGGSGWRIVERSGVSAAERCECSFRAQSNQAIRKAGIPPLYAHATLENFAFHDQQALQMVFSEVRGYARDFPFGDKLGLLLTGEPGTGKTHLAVAALKLIIGKGFEGLFFDFNNLLDQIRSGYDQTSGTINKDAYRSAMEAEVLLLDDLGAHRVTDWMLDTVTSIITYRCNNRKALVATTNLPDPDAGSAVVRSAGPGQAPEYRVTLGDRIGARARSRLFEMCRVIRMPDVPDYRLRRR